MTEQFKLSGPASLYFSYGQLMAYDSTEREPGSIWTDQHVKQGFVRRPHSVGIGTLMQDGTATLSIFRGQPTRTEAYDRVVSVPIDLPSGVLRLEGPDEYPIERSVDLTPGVFRLTFAQGLNEHGSLRIDLFIDEVDEPSPRSKVLKSDDSISDLNELIETGDVAI